MRAIDLVPRGETRFAWWVTVGFLAAALPRLWLHELWRDEATTWLLAAGAGTWAGLWAELAWGGHGYLWSVLCTLLRGFVESPRAMQLLNLGLAGGAAFVLARSAPLRRHERLLLVAGYFLFYEYAILSRDYAAGALLLFLGCAATASRRPFVALGLVICLLCQSTIYGFLLGLALGAGWLVDRRLRNAPLAGSRSELLAGATLAAVGAVAGLVQLVPAPGGVLSHWNLDWTPWRLARSLRIPWRAFVPLPSPELQFWNTNLLDPWPAVHTLAGCAMLGLAGLLLRRSRPALVTFGLGTAALLAFSYVKFHGSARHHGHLWLLFVAALWLAGGLERGARPFDWRRAVFLMLLAGQVAAGLIASWIDLRHPFSNGAAAARLIRERGLADLVRVGFRDNAVPSVALPLGRPFYMPSLGRFATHPDWGPRRRLQMADLRCEARALAASHRSDVLLVLNTREGVRWPETSFVGARLGAIAPGEDFRLHRLHHERLAATAAASACPGSGPTAPQARHQPANGTADSPPTPARARARSRSERRPPGGPPPSGPGPRSPWPPRG